MYIGRYVSDEDLQILVRDGMTKYDGLAITRRQRPSCTDSPLEAERAEKRMQFGEGLKQERERRGISLDHIAVSTRISMRHLHALEADRFAELPGGVFNRGIVRSYAQACGLDADGAVQSFVSALRASGMEETQRDDDWIALAEAVQRNRKVVRSGRGFGWLGVLLMLLVVVAIAVGVCVMLIHRGVVHLPAHLHLPGAH